MNELLAGIYDNLKTQAQAIFEMAVQIQALEMALNTNASFAELYKKTTQDVRKVLTPIHEQKVQVFDAVIQRLRQGGSLGDA